MSSGILAFLSRIWFYFAFSPGHGWPRSLFSLAVAEGTGKLKVQEKRKGRICGKVRCPLPRPDLDPSSRGSEVTAPTSNGGPQRPSRDLTKSVQLVSAQLGTCICPKERSSSLCFAIIELDQDPYSGSRSLGPPRSRSCLSASSSLGLRTPFSLEISTFLSPLLRSHWDWDCLSHCAREGGRQRGTRRDLKWG